MAASPLASPSAPTAASGSLTVIRLKRRFFLRDLDHGVRSPSWKCFSYAIYWPFCRRKIMIWDDSVKFIAFSLSSIWKRIRGKADLDFVKRWCKDPFQRRFCLYPHRF